MTSSTLPPDVTPQMLAEGQTSCNKTAGDIDTELASLRVYVSDLATLWLGVSSQQYQNLMGDYDRYARMLHDSLTGIADGLGGNMHNYTTTEVSIESTLQQVNGVIPGANLG